MKKNALKIPVVIVTKNRAKDLRECIGSLLVQSARLDELIIIDNNSTDATRSLIYNLQKNCTLPIRYVVEKRVGYPVVYNRGLKEAKSNWLAFIDDDCVADVDWYKNIKKTIQRFPEASIIVGKSNTYYSKNMFSLATSFFNQMWKENGKKGELVTDFATLDNKNIVYNKEFLLRNKLKFDENLLKNGDGAAEDIDLGLRIREHAGVAYFSSEVLVLHKDPTTFRHYVKKLKDANRAAQNVSDYIPISSIERRYRVRNWFLVFCQHNEIKGLLKLQLLLLILATVFWQKFTLQE